MKIRLAAAAAGLVTAAILVTACSGEQQGNHADSPSDRPTASPVDIAREADAAMRRLDSVTIRASQRLSRIGLSTTKAGRCKGSVTDGHDALTFVLIDDIAFERAPASYWQRNAEPEDVADLTALGTRWVRTRPTAELATYCDIDDLVDSIGLKKVRRGMVARVQERFLFEQQVLEISLDDGRKTRTVVVQARAPHRILHVEEPEQRYVLDFADFDESVAIEPPPEEDVVDASDLAQLAP